MPAAAAGHYPASTIAKLFNLTERRVQQLSKEGVIPKAERGKYELIGAVQGYVRYLQERSQGRSTTGGFDLAQERAHLAREQRLIATLKREQIERKQAPVELLTLALARASSQVAASLDAMVPKIKRRAPELPTSALLVVEEEIAAARNVAAGVTIEIDDTDGQKSSERE